MKKILLVEDEMTIAYVIIQTLQRSQFHIEHSSQGQQALERIENEEFDAYILDIMLPQINGFELAENIRKNNPQVPILFLTAKTDKEDIIKAYTLGANDFLRKPFHLEELIFRLNELLQRKKLLSIGEYFFDPIRQELYWNNETFTLSHRETELLKILVKNHGQLVERKIVLMKIWGNDDFFSARNMDAYISKLRKKLQKDSKIAILNMRGFGYKLIS